MVFSKFYSKIESAIANGWALRPIRNGVFNNINYQKNITLSNESHILKSVSDLTVFPEGTDCVALIPIFIKGFICLDFDSKDQEFNTQVYQVIKSYYKESELFLRKGHLEKLGQFWFKKDDGLNYEIKLPETDIITTSKRCDAIGFYKDKTREYGYPFKNLWDNTPNDLPVLTQECFDEIKSIFARYFDVFESTPSQNTGSRHDTLRNRVFARVMQGEHPLYIYQDILSSDEYHGISKDRGEDTALREVLAFFDKPIKEFLKNGDHKCVEVRENAIEAFTPKRPQVEKGSMLDILYQATKRNQHTNAPVMAFFSSLSLVSWLMTFSCRLNNLAPNLLILFVARSGSGKSTTSRLLKEFLSEFPILNHSFGDGTVKTQEAFYRGFENSPNRFYLIDEYTKLLKSKLGNNSHTSGITESFCQYYNDFNDNFLQKVSLSHYNYGVCYGPKLNALMFTTPEFRKVFKREDFLGGLGRRTLMVVDESLILSKKVISYENYFLNWELSKIRSFMSEFIFSDEEFLSHEIYEKKDISFLNLRKQTSGKNQSPFYKEVLAFKTKHKLTMCEEALNYMQDEHIDMANKLKIDSAKSANQVNEIIVNSFTEFTLKLAMIHSIAGKLEPSLEIQLDSIQWAQDMFHFYMADSLTSDIESIFDSNSKEIHELAENFYSKLIDENVETFNLSHTACRSFFQNKKRLKLRSEVFNLLEIDKKISVKNKKSSKRSLTYKVHKDTN